MKAVIVEIRDKYVAVLSNDGRIYKIRNDNYTIGQEIEMKKYSVNNGRFIKTAAAVAASIMVFIAPAWAYLTPYSYVSLDVNPSLEYTVNIFDRVLSVKAVNDDGEKILEEINLDELKNKNIEVAVQEVVNSIIEAGFFEKEQEGGIVIAASSKNDEKSQALADKLKSQVEEQVKVQESIESDVEVEAIGVGEERVQEAKELGVTPGKLNLVEKLQESSENPDDINIEDWLKKPVKEIMKETKKNKKIEKIEDKKTEKMEDKKYNSESDEASINDEKTSEVKDVENEKKLNNKNDKFLDNVDNENKHIETDEETNEDSKSEEVNKSEEAKKSKKEKQNSAEKEHNDNKKIKSN